MLLCLSVLAHIAPFFIQPVLVKKMVVVAVAAVGAIDIAYIVAFRLTPAMLIRLRERAARWRNVYLLIALAVALSMGINLQHDWVYVHIALMVSMGLALGYHLLYADSPPLNRFWTAAALLLVAIVTFVRIYGLSVYPDINAIDEPWIMGWALSYVHHGYFSDTIMYYGGSDIQRFMLPVAWWMSIFGAGFWQTRLFFFLLIFPLIGLTVLAARNWSISGGVTAIIMLSSAVVMGAARIRHDVGLALAIAASIWLYTEAQKRQKHVLHLLAGMAIGLGLFAHYHAILFGVALNVSLYLPEYVDRLRRRQWLPQVDAILFGLGGLIGALIVFFLQILPDWQGFLAVRQTRSPLSLAQLIPIFISHWGSIAYQSRLEVLIVVAALVIALWRRRRIDVRLVLLVITLHIALTLQAAENYDQYVLPISPVYALLIAAVFTQGLSRAKLHLAYVAAALFMFVNLGFTLQLPLRHLLEGGPLQPPTPPAATWVLEHVDPSKSVVSEHWYYTFLTNYKFISPWTPEYMPLSLRGKLPPDQLWDQMSPDVVIIDRNMPTCCIAVPIYNLQYLQARGYKQVAAILGGRYPVIIYEKFTKP